MDSDILLTLDQASGLELRMREAGFTTQDVESLCNSGMLQWLLPAIRGQAAVTNVRSVIDCDAAPLIPYLKWNVVKHIQRGKIPWDPSKFTLQLSQSQQKEEKVQALQIQSEMEGAQTENANLLDYLISHPYLIPEKWKKGKDGKIQYILFWATIYENPSLNVTVVPSLYFSGGVWKIHYRAMHKFSDFQKNYVSIVREA